MKRARSRWLPILIVQLALLIPAGSNWAGGFEVDIELPIRPKLRLTGKESLVLAPFLVGSRIKDEEQDTRLDVDGEFRRFLGKQIERKTKLTVRESPRGLRLPTLDAQALRRETAFWRELAETTDADLVIAGLIDFDIEDRTGYQREEYVSPVDGRTYYRQVLVEETGYGFDIELWALDGKTGDLLLQENMKAFRTQEGRRRDELSGLFENLYNLEDRLLTVFVSRDVKAKRHVFD